METPYDAELDQLRARYSAQRAALGEMQRSLAQISATAVGAQRCVQVTVDAQGQLTELSFPTEAYRQMAPQELAAMVFAVVTQAQAEAGDAVRQVMAGYRSDNGFLDVTSGRDDWSRLLPEDLPGLDEVLRPTGWGSRGAGPGDATSDAGDVTWNDRTGWADGR
ncbi:YbaB/EbfC family nucleoid-associated protein [Salinispora arenicola]|uniref:YbaB/EbfC DNA-binding family protein n=1 Tax=Salinispora arenicola TaxID=168697 RepID=A0A542XHG6_SALAC|nr:YbaB/EbfC family nucleoid-associated protein [Salinispora arenicola]TQL35288.1 YbaB/EbfC DNA-binding family protein [Salinispora arenicola]GIM86010.1 hypothetical protein Sar04_27460 [Salinispora arenicola]